MRNFADKSCRKNQNTQLLFNNFFSKIVPFMGLTWKNMVEPVRPQMTIRRMRIAYWIPKATNTHSEYVILLTFPLQQWLHELASMLRHTYIACLAPPPPFSNGKPESGLSRPNLFSSDDDTVDTLRGVRSAPRRSTWDIKGLYGNSENGNPLSPIVPYYR